MLRREISLGTKERSNEVLTKEAKISTTQRLGYQNPLRNQSMSKLSALMINVTAKLQFALLQVQIHQHYFLLLSLVGHEQQLLQPFHLWSV